MATATSAPSSIRERLDRLFKQRIVIFDGSIGVLLQKQGLTEEDWRGGRFRPHPPLLKKHVAILNPARPHVASPLHREYPGAGSDPTPPTTCPTDPASQP